jgi:hypothetical protein
MGVVELVQDYLWESVCPHAYGGAAGDRRHRYQ